MTEISQAAIIAAKQLNAFNRSHRKKPKQSQHIIIHKRVVDVKIPDYRVNGKPSTYRIKVGCE